MQAFIDFLLARAQEKTTWLGLVGLLMGVIGIEATSIQTEQVAGAVTVLVTTVIALLPEKK